MSNQRTDTVRSAAFYVNAAETVGAEFRCLPVTYSIEAGRRSIADIDENTKNAGLELARAVLEFEWKI